MATIFSAPLNHAACGPEASLWDGRAPSRESSGEFRTLVFPATDDVGEDPSVGQPSSDGHPGADSASSDIVAHAIHVHHPALRGQLLWIAALLGKIRTQSPSGERQWHAVRTTFADLRQELIGCLMRERYIIFPHILAASDAELRESASFLGAVRAVEKSHGRSLPRLWKLMDVTTQAAPLAEDAEGCAALVAELDALRDGYYQHLFEMECLLFPRLAPRTASGHLAHPPCSSAADARFSTLPT